MLSVYCHIRVLFMSLGLSSILFKNCIDPYARKTHMRSAPSRISHRRRQPLSHLGSRLPRPLRCLSTSGTSTRRVVHVWSLESTRIKTTTYPSNFKFDRKPTRDFAKQNPRVQFKNKFSSVPVGQQSPVGNFLSVSRVYGTWMTSSLVAAERSGVSLCMQLCVVKSSQYHERTAGVIFYFI